MSESVIVTRAQANAIARHWPNQAGGDGRDKTIELMIETTNVQQAIAVTPVGAASAATVLIARDGGASALHPGGQIAKLED